MYSPPQMNSLNKKELLEVLKQLGDLPYKKQVIEETFASLPKNLANGVAYKMYLKYSYKGDIYGMLPAHGILNTPNYFTSVNSIVTFLKETSVPNAHSGYIMNVINGKAKDYMGWVFFKVEREDI